MQLSCLFREVSTKFACTFALRDLLLPQRLYFRPTWGKLPYKIRSLVAAMVSTEAAAAAIKAAAHPFADGAATRYTAGLRPFFCLRMLQARSSNLMTPTASSASGA